MKGGTGMRTRTYRMAMAVITIALLPGLVGGCGKREQRQARIRIVGSTSVFPFAEMLAEAYEKHKPQIEVDVQAGGSTVGIISARDGLCDIGTSSRNLREEEKEGVKVIEMARDGIAIILHPSNKIDSLTTEQIRDIYSQKIKNWKEVGGDDAAIAFVTREEGSGTRGAFTEIVMKGTRIDPHGLVQDSNGSVREAVATSPYAIGYISLALVNEKVKAIAVDGVGPTNENLTNGTYPVVRPFLFVVKGEPKGEVKNFIDFVLADEGQRVLRNEGLLAPANG
jgi:phosphate transport system substrate-binding protein